MGGGLDIFDGWSEDERCVTPEEQEKFDDFVDQTADLLSDFTTAGEHLLQRILVKEDRSGVTHYVQGQHEAEDLSDGLFSLGYVDVMGHACLVIFTHEDDWCPVMGRRAGQTRMEEVADTSDLKVTDAMREVLDAARN